MTTAVDMHLCVRTEGLLETQFVRALSVPLQDIKKLTTRPLKWLRFTTFVVCGARGHLSATRGGKAADYGSVTFDSILHEYFYDPKDTYHLVDLETFNDQITSSSATTRRSGFRQDICDHDDTCVITTFDRERCDAAHIIPCSKDSEYITRVVHDLRSSYEPSDFLSQAHVDLNCVQNGMLLRTDLHGDFGDAIIAFLRTPNFAIEPADVPRIEGGPIPCLRTTLQYMQPRVQPDAVPPRDVQVDWSNDTAPPSILLDFMYGAAVVEHWKCDRLRSMLDQQHKDVFRNIPRYPKHSTPRGDEDDPENAEQGDLSAGPSTRSLGKGKERARKTLSPDASADLPEAMDDVLYLSMLVRGITPQRIVAEREKCEKENELRSQEHSVEKVQQWLNLSRPP